MLFCFNRFFWPWHHNGCYELPGWITRQWHQRTPYTLLRKVWGMNYIWYRHSSFGNQRKSLATHQFLWQTHTGACHTFWAGSEALSKSILSLSTFSSFLPFSRTRRGAGWIALVSSRVSTKRCFAIFTGLKCPPRTVWSSMSILKECSRQSTYKSDSCTSLLQPKRSFWTSFTSTLSWRINCVALSIDILWSSAHTDPWSQLRRMLKSRERLLAYIICASISCALVSTLCSCTRLSLRCENVCWESAS